MLRKLSDKSNRAPLSFKKAQKQDAIALAELIYDLFKEEQRYNNRGSKGQNYAIQSTKE